jgi:hypothetical protein
MGSPKYGGGMKDSKWVRDKDSWVIHTTKEENGWFDPLDPPRGVWSIKDLTALLGLDLKVVPLKGKWEGEVLVHQPSNQGYRNGLAMRLARESLGSSPVLRGKVLMTIGELIQY